MGAQQAGAGAWGDRGCEGRGGGRCSMLLGKGCSHRQQQLATALRSKEETPHIFR